MLEPPVCAPAGRSAGFLASLAFSVLLALTVAAAVGACGGVTTAAPVPGDQATVSRVVDGDTIVAKVAGRDERIRFLGMDTPESVKPNTPVQCYAKEASAQTQALLPPGTPVRLVRDAELRDQYGRLLAYVYRRRDNLFVNMALVEDGFAVPDEFRPNVAHASDIRSAAVMAKAAGRGLWSACPASSIPHHPGGP